MVSSVSKDNESVTVEWYEKGETKGKEVCIPLIYKEKRFCSSPLSFLILKSQRDSPQVFFFNSLFSLTEVKAIYITHFAMHLFSS